MRFRSLLAPLPPLLFFTFGSLTLILPTQAESLTGRRASLHRYREHGSQSWAARDGQRGHAVQEVIAVRKMMDSEGEMFFPEYWRFNHEADDWDEDPAYNPKDLKLPNDKTCHRSNTVDFWRNASIFLPYEAPFALHRNTDTSPSSAHWVRDLLTKRDFQCPSGTSACVGINRPTVRSWKTEAKATSHAVVAARRAPATSRIALKDTRHAPALKAADAASLATLVSGP
ncbi:MAG: hypothetical protein LQ341_002961 [Variospora aurantia]|nr:MAG: hypothetical protein LQ341_002961 [Variospora aurantia]